jgi:E1A/CREB-binding protein
MYSSHYNYYYITHYSCYTKLITLLLLLLLSPPLLHEHRYITMLEDAQSRGIVQTITNIYDDNWSDPNADATSLPYLEGDYWIGEAENIIKELEDEESGTSDYRNSKSGSKSKKKGASRKRLVKSEAGSSTTGGSSRDPLMQKLGEVIAPMKTSFIVAYLLPREFAREMAQRRAREVEILNANTACQMAAAAGLAPDPAAVALAKQPVQPDETEAGEDTMFSDILDTRQTFLNLCQGNHYQFDQLRRAKHSSMMVSSFVSTMHCVLYQCM